MRAVPIVCFENQKAMRGEFKGFFIMKQIYNDALQFCIDRCSNVASNKPIELFFAFKIDLKID